MVERLKVWYRNTSKAKRVAAWVGAGLAVLVVISMVTSPADEQLAAEETTTTAGDTTTTVAQIETTTTTETAGPSLEERFTELATEAFTFFAAEAIDFEEALASWETDGDPWLLEMLDVQLSLDEITGMRETGSFIIIETGLHPDGSKWLLDNREIAEKICNVAISGSYELKDEIIWVEVADKFGGRLAKCEYRF